MSDSDGVSKKPKVLNISVSVKDLRAVQEALFAARRALRMQEQECRFHGTAWVMSRWNPGEVWCESCRKPYMVVKALEKLKGVME
jgi:Zn finger protein HypA/HybF involved in hydrogenase expression